MNPINSQRAPWYTKNPTKPGKYLVTDGEKVQKAEFNGQEWIDQQLAAVIGWRNLKIPKPKKDK
jgi:hypothetical protein